MKAATRMPSRSSPVRSTWLSLRSACVKTSLATAMQSNRFDAGMFLVQLISGENDDVDGAAGFAPGNSRGVMGSFNYRLERPRAFSRSRIILQSMARTPVFIVGAPRSGTTLLRVTLNRHSQLAVCGETDYFRRVYARRYAFGDPGDPRNRERIVGAYLALEPVRRLGMDLGVLRESLMLEGVRW